jgi:hypothetical protein
VVSAFVPLITPFNGFLGLVIDTSSVLYGKRLVADKSQITNHKKQKTNKLQNTSLKNQTQKCGQSLVTCHCHLCTSTSDFDKWLRKLKDLRANILVNPDNSFSPGYSAI